MAPVPRPSVVAALPRTLYLETTNRCDSTCQTCVRTFVTLEPPRDLTLGEVDRILAQFPHLDRVVLHGIGEPLLNRDLFAIIERVKATGAAVLFNSDAITLTPARAARLIETGLDEYRVSMDAASRETYRLVRGVDRFARVVANVRELVALERRLGRETPRVSLWFTAMRVNLGELPAFVRLAAELGVAEIYVQRMVFHDRGLAVAEQSLHRALQEREAALLHDAEALARDLGIVVKASGLQTPRASLSGADVGTRPWAGCERPWTLSYVTANGHVLPCCIAPWTATDYAGALLGNAFTERFDSIWNGERYRRFRETFESETPPDPCRGCGLRWSV